MYVCLLFTLSFNIKIFYGHMFPMIGHIILILAQGAGSKLALDRDGFSHIICLRGPIEKILFSQRILGGAHHIISCWTHDRISSWAHHRILRWAHNAFWSQHMIEYHADQTIEYHAAQPYYRILCWAHNRISCRVHRQISRLAHNRISWVDQRISRWAHCRM